MITIISILFASKVSVVIHTFCCLSSRITFSTDMHPHFPHPHAVCLPSYSEKNLAAGYFDIQNISGIWCRWVNEENRDICKQASLQLYLLLALLLGNLGQIRHLCRHLTRFMVWPAVFVEKSCTVQVLVSQDLHCLSKQHGRVGLSLHMGC